jgi:hypothetical protein
MSFPTASSKLPARDCYTATIYHVLLFTRTRYTQGDCFSAWWGQLIIRIKAKCRLLAPTTEKSWQSLLLSRYAQLIERTLAQHWGSINTLIHWRVRYYILYSLSHSRTCILFWLKHRNACRYNPPPMVNCCSTEQDSSSSEGFIGPTTFSDQQVRSQSKYILSVNWSLLTK